MKIIPVVTHITKPNPVKPVNVEGAKELFMHGYRGLECLIPSWEMRNLPDTLPGVKYRNAAQGMRELEHTLDVRFERRTYTMKLLYVP